MMKKNIKLTKAQQFAHDAHEGQLDDSGQSYFDAHVSQVVSILWQITEDEDVICAAWLHDVVEDCGITYEQLVSEFSTNTFI